MTMMSTLLLNVSPIRNFGDAIAVQDLSGIHVWNFVCYFPPSNQNPGAAPDSHPDITICQFLTMKLLTILHSVLLVD